LSESFDFVLPELVIFGRGSLSRVGGEATRLGAGQALVVTSQGMLRRPALLQVSGALRDLQIESRVFAGVEPEPTLESVHDCVSLARDTQSDLIIGLGGGSALDVAKKSAAELGISTIMVPSTAGSGSEVTHEVDLRTNGEKRVFVDGSLTPDVAIVDPDVSSTTTPRQTALSGLDALAHAIESAESTAASPPAKALARQARSILVENLASAVSESPEAKDNMALGSLMAGMAAGNSGTGLCHALASALADLGMTHAEAVAVMLPHAMEFNGSDVEEISCVRQVLSSAGIRPRFTGDVPEMAAKVMNDTARLGRNPREVGLPDVLSIYRRARRDLV
jgi:alcohol dehydrogenase class IV